MSRLSPTRAAVAAAAVLSLVLPAGAGAATTSGKSAKNPLVWAHRGGSYVNGKAKYPENTLPAFRAAAKQGFALEFDINLTQDGVPLVIHDPTLDRTTACTGKVADKTYAEIRDNCKTDVLGSPGGPLDKASKKTAPTVSLPTLAQVLAVAKQYKVRALPELKELDTTGASARALAAGLKASRIGLGDVVVQSFLPPELTDIRTLIPSISTSQLTISEPVAALQVAISGKATWVSPQLTKAITPAYVTKAHKAKLKIALYTLDTKSDIKRARTLGVEAAITDDPTMARTTLKRR
jgi:glycerophosphoryl diester phosphodiesterase